MEPRGGGRFRIGGLLKVRLRCAMLGMAHLISAPCKRLKRLLSQCPATFPDKQLTKHASPAHNGW